MKIQIKQKAEKEFKIPVKTSFWKATFNHEAYLVELSSRLYSIRLGAKFFYTIVGFLD